MKIHADNMSTRTKTDCGLSILIMVGLPILLIAMMAIGGWQGCNPDLEFGHSKAMMITGGISMLFPIIVISMFISGYGWADYYTPPVAKKTPEIGTENTQIDGKQQDENTESEAGKRADSKKETVEKKGEKVKQDFSDGEVAKPKNTQYFDELVIKNTETDAKKSSKNVIKWHLKMKKKQNKQRLRKIKRC
jgi:hypothetical protein